jgi:hypothetical protein
MDLRKGLTGRSSSSRVVQHKREKSVTNNDDPQPDRSGPDADEA